jgi:hypothetical protein
MPQLNAETKPKRRLLDLGPLDKRGSDSVAPQPTTGWLGEET